MQPSHAKLISEIDVAIAKARCALRQPRIPEHPHQLLKSVDAVPEVKRLYPEIFALYDKDPDSKSFRELLDAVTLGAYDYYEKVPQPMSLRCVLDKIVAGEYANKSQVFQDIDLIWANCFHYNGSDSPFSKLADSCRRKLEARLVALEDNEPAPSQEQDEVAGLIENTLAAHGEDFLKEMTVLLERHAPNSVKDGDLDVGLLSKKACRELRAFIEKKTTIRKRDRE